MVGPLRDSVVSVLKKFSTPGGDRSLRIAALWEAVLGEFAKETQILKIENRLLFVKIKDSIMAQEMKIRFQRVFLEKYEKEFGEKLKDIRFIVGDLS